MKKLTLFAMMLLAACFAFAQDDDIDGSTLDQPVRRPVETPWEQVNTGDFTEPIAYTPVRQADVMYYWTIWRIIDLREKVNHPLYFPAEQRGTWRSLAQTIFDAIALTDPEKTEDVLPIYSDEMCTMPYSREEVQGILSQTSTIDDIDDDGEVIGTKELIQQFEAKEVIMMSTKGQAIRVAMKEIPTLGRATQGVRIMRMSDGDTVASIGIVLPEEETSEEAAK